MPNDYFIHESIWNEYSEYAARFLDASEIESTRPVLVEKLQTTSEHLTLSYVFRMAVDWTLRHELNYTGLQSVRMARIDEHVDVYDATRKKLGWASGAEVEEQARLQASAVVPGPEFYAWLSDAIERYFEDQDKAARKGGYALEDFYNAFMSVQEIETLSAYQCKSFFGESSLAMRCHAGAADAKFCNIPHEPRLTVAADTHMSSSFRNRVKSIDWAYYLHED